MERVECVVIGAGVIGLAVAAELAMRGREVIVIERHDVIGSETSSRNSEVIHAGIYYPQDSLKALMCVQGKELLYRFCEAHGVGYRRCGKVIVAVQEEQLATVRQYAMNAERNGVHDLRWLEADEVNELEPEVMSVGGVLSPSTGIIDSHGYMLALQGLLESHGGLIALNTSVETISAGADGVDLSTDAMTLRAGFLVNAAGLQAPELAATMIDAPRPYYAKGHYYAYSGKQPFTRLVYPVAEEGGLGVHVTLDLGGQVKFGPDVRWIDHVDYSFDEGYFEDFFTAIRAYYPAADRSRLHPSYTGIRPKIAPPEQGFQDFVIQGPATHGVPGVVHLLGIESPGLTASLAIARRVATELEA